MNFKPPFIGYILVYVRYRSGLEQAKQHPTCRVQTLQIERFVKKHSPSATVVYDQTTNAKTRVWLRPQFLRAAQLASEAAGVIVVGDLVEMVKHLDEAVMRQGWKEIHSRYPNLVSAKHFEAVHSGIRINTDLSGVILRRANRKTREPSNKEPVRPAGGKNVGARGTSRKSDMLAKHLGPILGEILKIFPDAGPTHVSKALNDRGILSSMGGKWHPSSASNLLVKCRKLGIIEL
jgi:hypothetical protein